MKTRLFTVSAFLVRIALLALLGLGGAQPSSAQPQPAAPVAAPDRAQVRAALQSAPLMFIENVGW